MKESENMGKKDWLRAEDRDTSCAGKSLREIMEDMLDDEVETFAPAVLAGEERTPEILEAQGRARGISSCIALILQPYYPDPDAVRDAAMSRFYENHPELAEEDED